MSPLNRLHDFTTDDFNADNLNEEFDNIVVKLSNLTAADFNLGVLTITPYVLATEATDLGTQLTNAMAAGKYLYLPPGDYTMGAYDLLNDAKIIGAGAEKCVITGEIDTPNDTLLTIDGVSDITISGVTINLSNSSGLETNKIVTINASSTPCRNIKFSDVKFVADTSEIVKLIDCMYTATPDDDEEITASFVRCYFNADCQILTCGRNADVLIDESTIYINEGYSIEQDDAVGDELDNLLIIRNCKIMVDHTDSNEAMLFGGRCGLANNYILFSEPRAVAAMLGAYTQEFINNRLFVPPYITQAILVSEGGVVKYNSISGAQTIITFGTIIAGPGDDYEWIFNTINGDIAEPTLVAPNRNRVPRVAKTVTRLTTEDRLKPLSLGDCYLNLQSTGDGGAPNKLVITRVINQWTYVDAETALVGTTDLLS